MIFSLWKPRNEPVLLSVVIPVFNEEATLDALFATVQERLGSMGISYEVVLIDDGSRDRRITATRPFPDQLLNRPYLIAAAVGHWLGVNDYAYAVDYAKGFTDMWRVASGRWALAERSGGLR